MDKLIAPCGNECHACPAYIATQADDAEKIATLAAAWSQQYGADVKPEYVWCDGCLAASARKCGHAAECEIRACVLERGLANCAACGDYGCEKITAFFKMAPDAKVVLDGLRD